MRFLIHRYNPETDKKPRMQEYTLDGFNSGDMLLAHESIKDAIEAQKKEDIHTLSSNYRHQPYEIPQHHPRRI